MRFEATTFIDAIRRTCLVQKQAKELDKYPGVEFRPTGNEFGHVTIRGTDGDVSVVITLEDRDHDPTAMIAEPFLLPADRLYQLFNTGSRKWSLVHVEDGDSEVRFSVAEIKASLMKVRGTLPPPPGIRPEDMIEANSFGSDINLVAWARETAGDGPLSGIHVTPHSIGCTDKFAGALVTGKTGVNGTCLLPAEPLRKVFKGLGEFADTNISIGLSGERAFISPRPHIVYSLNTIAGADKYPPLEDVFAKEGIFSDNRHIQALIDVRAFLAASRRAESVSGHHLGQKVELTFDEDVMHLSSRQSEGGDYEETIPLLEPMTEVLDHTVIMLTKNLTNVLSRLPQKGSVMHLPAEATGGDIRFEADNHWMLLGRVVIR